jgi:hypothetical protein
MCIQDAKTVGAQDFRYPVLSLMCTHNTYYRMKIWNPARSKVRQAERWFIMQILNNEEA